MGQKYLVYGSLKNALTWKQLLKEVKQKYEDYKILLMLLVQHQPLLVVILQDLDPQQGLHQEHLLQF